MKKLLSLFCTLSLSAALLAGCSGGNGNTNAAADGAESTSPTLTEPETTSQQETAAPVDVNVMALKPKRVVTNAKPLADTPIVNLSRYRARSLPIAGALLREEDRGETQMSLLEPEEQ